MCVLFTSHGKYYSQARKGRKRTMKAERNIQDDEDTEGIKYARIINVGKLYSIYFWGFYLI